MKLLLAILCGLALQAGAITNGVFATKSPYVVEAATMPFSLWTNSVLWLTAESPVLDAGTTNANWLCYAKTCAGNATQTTLAIQPTTITTNGRKSLYFDGGDWLEIPTSAMTVSNITLMAWLYHDRGLPATGSRDYSIATRTTAGDRMYMSTVSPNGTYFIGIGSSFISTGVAYTDQTNWVHVALSFNDSNYAWYRNGVLRSSGAYTGLNTLGNKVFIGQGSINDELHPNFEFQGRMDDLRIFNMKVESNAVHQIFNNTKGKYGL